MAPSDNGIFDNNKALKRVEALIAVKPKDTFGDRLAEAGLRMWFGIATGAQFMRSLQRDTSDMTKLPKPLFDALAELTQNPNFSKTRDNRTSAVRKIVGPALSGWRIDVLFEQPNVKALVTPIVETNAANLDATLAASSTDKFQKQGMIELGVLTVMTEIGFKHPAARVDAWAAGFSAMNERTRNDREFWDPFVARVTPAFALLRK